MGDSNKAFEDIQAFIDVYSHEKDVLRQWHQAKDRISKQSCRKRAHKSEDYEAYLMQFATPTISDEYFNAVYDHAHYLILEGKIVDAIGVLANVYDFIQKTHQMSQLSQNYILQATALLVKMDFFFFSKKTTFSITLNISILALPKRPYPF